MQTQNRILRRAEVQEITGLARSTIYMLASKGEFPQPVKLTAKAVGWHKATIDEWVASRVTAGVR